MIQKILNIIFSFSWVILVPSSDFTFCLILQDLQLCHAEKAGFPHDPYALRFQRFQRVFGSIHWGRRGHEIGGDQLQQFISIVGFHNELRRSLWDLLRSAQICQMLRCQGRNPKKNWGFLEHMLQIQSTQLNIFNRPAPNIDRTSTIFKFHHHLPLLKQTSPPIR